MAKAGNSNPMKKTGSWFAIGAAFAALSGPAAAVEFYGDAYGFNASDVPRGAYGMRVTGPGGFVVEVDSLSYDSSEQLPDGGYRYEIIGKMARKGGNREDLNAKNRMDQGRSVEYTKRTTRDSVSGVVASGHFRINGGTVQVPREEAEN